MEAPGSPREPTLGVFWGRAGRGHGWGGQGAARGPGLLSNDTVCACLWCCLACLAAQGWHLHTGPQGIRREKTKCPGSRSGLGAGLDGREGDLGLIWAQE